MRRLIRERTWIVACTSMLLLIALIGGTVQLAATPVASRAASRGAVSSSSQTSTTLPEFKLPYSQGVTVYWTGGPHGYNEGGNLSGTYNAGDGSGIDFANGTNFDVLAMAAGTVVDSGCNLKQAFGCQIAVQHDVGGSVLIYAHLLEGSLNFRKGQHVSQGSMLAKAGATGTGANGVTHLHLELRDGAISSNGKWLCTRECLPGGLGGNPLGWDGRRFVDGYYIVGYCVQLADPCTGPSSFYNYDGSAVKSSIQKPVNSFPYHDYIDSVNYVNRTAIVSVDPDFQCSGSDPTNCEVNVPGAATQFAGHGLFSSPALLPSTSGVRAASSNTSAGQLVSSNLAIPPTTPTWYRQFASAPDTSMNSVKPTRDGGYIVVGNKVVSGISEAWVWKFDQLGNLIWEKSYSGSANYLLYSVVTTDDGGYIAVGYSSNSDGSNPDGWIIKLDSFGNLVWQNTYGSGNFDYLGSLAMTSDGGFVVAGNTLPYGGPYNGWVLKFDGSGNILWQKRYSSFRDDTLASIFPTSDGGFIGAGTAYMPSTNEFDMRVLKLDSSGNIMWEKTYGTTTRNEYAYSVVEVSGGNFVVVGQGVGLGNNISLFLKLDSLGNIVWQRIYSGKGHFEAFAVTRTSGGGVVVAGDSDDFGPTYYNAWLVKLDDAGNIVWDRTYSTNGSITERLSFVTETTDGGLIGVGGFDIPTIMKVDSNGNMSRSCNIIGKGAGSLSQASVTVRDDTLVVEDTTVAPVSSAVTVGSSTSTASAQCGP
jgi:murein DD-endopeptidase MepM/ murein hydrolase activator NlpD